ncbi:hypothetical protein [Desulfovibrio sp.]
MTRLLTAIAIIGFLACAGCASEEFKEPLGASVRQAVAAQKLAAAPAGDAPVVGLDGVYAKGVMDNYHKPPKSSSETKKTLQLNLGGSGDKK